MITFFTTLVVSTVLYATKPADASVGEAAPLCGTELLRSAGVPTTDSDREVATLLNEVSEQCPTPTACTTRELKAEFLRATETKKTSTARQVGYFFAKVGGRVAVFGLWAGAIGGAAWVSNWITSSASESVQQFSTALSMFVADRIFGRIASPLTDQYGPLIDQFGNFLWSSNGRWGRMARKCTAADREASTEVCRLILTIDDYLGEGAARMASNNIEAAADHYLSAILSAVDLHADFNLNEPSVKRKAQFHLKRQANITPATAKTVIEAALNQLEHEDSSFFPKDLTRLRIAELVRETLESWFSNILSSEPAKKDAV